MKDYCRFVSAQKFIGNPWPFAAASKL